MKREILPTTAAALLALGLTAACTEADPRKPEIGHTTLTNQPDAAEQLPVTNISEHPLDVSDNPTSTNIYTRKGFLEAGQTALASCIVTVPGFPESTSVFVTFDDAEGAVEGYVGTHAPYDPSGRGGEPQLEPLDQINRLPHCNDDTTRS